MIAFVLPVFLGTEHWIEDAGHRFADRMVWREPIESWGSLGDRVLKAP